MPPAIAVLLVNSSSQQMTRGAMSIVAIDIGIALATVLRWYVYVISNNRYLKINY